MIPRHLQIMTAVLLLALIASGIYIYQLTRREERNTMRTDDPRPVTPLASDKKESVPVVIAYDVEGVLRRESLELSLPSDPGERARLVLRALVARYAERASPHAVGEGSDVRHVFFLRDGRAVVDLTAAFTERHPSGILEETLTLASLAATLKANFPAVRSVKFLIEGEERETLAGHAGLRNFLEHDQISAFLEAAQ